MSDETKDTCARCGQTKELKQYTPNLGKHPGKTVKVCDECAGRDNKLLAVEKPVDVPAIEPAVPADKAEEVPVKEFKAVPPEPIKISTPKNAPGTDVHDTYPKEGQPKPAEAKALCTEPISREEIRKKLADCERDADKLKESKQGVLAQAEQVKTKLQQVQNMINVTNVRIANYRDLLGEKG